MKRIKKKKSERKTKRQRNAKRRAKQHEYNRKLKLQKRETNKILQKLPEIIDEALKEKANPPQEKKVVLHPQMGPRKYKDDLPAINLQDELKGCLKDMQPVGNLVYDSFHNIQRRNKLEVRKRKATQIGKKHPKYKIQYVVGGRKGGDVMGRHYEY